MGKHVLKEMLEVATTICSGPDVHITEPMLATRYAYWVDAVPPNLVLSARLAGLRGMHIIEATLGLVEDGDTAGITADRNADKKSLDYDPFARMVLDGFRAFLDARNAPNAPARIGLSGGSIISAARAAGLPIFTSVAEDGSEEGITLFL